MLSALLRSYARLEHLVLDRVNLFGFTAREKGADLCKDLGGMCVSAGLARGKERERQIAAWELVDRTRKARIDSERRTNAPRRSSDDEVRDDSGSGTGESSQDEESLAAVQEAEAVAIERQRQIAVSRARRGHRSAAHSTFSLRDRPLRNRTAGSTSASGSSIPVPPADRLYLVLPPLPTLKTVSIGGEAHSLVPAKLAQWEDQFHAGWRDGLAKLLGWATHIEERYNRAKRKAEEWSARETKQAQAIGKGKARASAVVGTRPPTDIRLFRFPNPDEPVEQDDPSDPAVGLIEIHPEGRECLEMYTLAIADAELYVNNHSLPPPCVLCTVPDCEGPARRGAEGEKIDGRGGMSGKHRDGCGHLSGRTTWGWGAV